MSPERFGWLYGRQRRATVILVSTGVLVLGVLVVLAIALSSTQAASKSEIEARVRDRAVVAAALVNSLFATVDQQAPATEREFGGAKPSDALLNKGQGSSAYLTVLTESGQVLASSTGFTPRAQTELLHSGVLKLIRDGDAYALGNLQSYGKTGVIALALRFSSPHGTRILVEGVRPAVIDDLLDGELRRIPGVAGSHNLIVDANDTVIASNLSSRPAGYHIQGAAGQTALAQPSGDRDGRYFDHIALSNSTWTIVLSAPNGPLFASVSGWHRWVPWLIFAGFALFALIALALGWRVLHSAEQDLAVANAQLAAVNRELEDSNQRLARRAEELARSNAELDQFASIASHDLQEPLRKVRTFTEQLAATEAEGLSEQGADYLMRANRAAERMQRLIQDLLQFSRVTTKPRPFTPVDLNEVAAEVLDDLSIELESSGTNVSVGDLPSLDADPLQMRQLMLNLVSNAIKFRRDGVTPEISIRGAVIGDNAQLVVADNGIGFEPRYSTRIFRVFERLNGRDAYPGTGIGLALCYKIVGRHGGSIVAESELDMGATFTVMLPRKQHNQPLDMTDDFELDHDDAKEQAHVTT